MILDDISGGQGQTDRGIDRGYVPIKRSLMLRNRIANESEHSTGLEYLKHEKSLSLLRKALISLASPRGFEPLLSA
jgi:hypothetical protein